MADTSEIISDAMATERCLSGIAAPLRRVASRWRFIACVQALDFATFFLIGAAWFPRLMQASPSNGWALTFVMALIAATMMHCVFQCFRLYDFSVLTRGPESAFRTFSASVMSSGTFLSPLIIQPSAETGLRSVMLAYLCAAILGVACMRFGIARLAASLARSGVVGRKVYIVASTSETALKLAEQLELVPENQVIGTWNFAGRVGSPETLLEAPLAFLRDNPVDAVILKMPLSQPERLLETIRILRRVPRDILLAPEIEGIERIVPRHQPPGRSEWPSGMAMIKISDRPLAGWRWLMKDLLDRAMALGLLVLVAPAMLAIMIGIKMSDPGPVFFRQKRRGYGGRTFDIIKFRTMRTASTAPADSTSLKLTTRNDPRVFPFGHLLRKTSLDELPQLLNVLYGDMWIVGPRPHSPYAQAGGLIYADAVQDYAARYRIKPGITGWAQVSGWRGPTDTLEQLNQRVEHDLYYIENWSLLFDVRILVKTAFVAFGQENAF